MKALTLTQPWATLMAIGAKRIETRSWKTNYRGRVAIHAAKGFPGWARDFTLEPCVYEAVRRNQRPFGGPSGYPLGMILATATLVNVLPTEVLDNSENVFSVSCPSISDQERAFGDYSAGRFGWIFEDIRQFDYPIPIKGALGLWTWDDQASTEGSQGGKADA